MNPKKVELVYFTGCPNAEEARENIRHALTEMGRSAPWVEWDLECEETPARYGIYGSPTVLVGGRNVTEAPAAAAGLSCSAGGAPQVAEIVRALKS
jgi:hypothetical protein